MKERSKNQLAAIKRWSNPEFKKKVSEKIRSTINSKEFIERKIRKLQDKLSLNIDKNK